MLTFERPSHIIATDQHGRTGALRADGSVAIPFAYGSLEDQGHNRILACKNDKHGILSKHGKTLVPFRYRYIWARTPVLVVVEQGKRRCFINIRTGVSYEAPG